MWRCCYYHCYQLNNIHSASLITELTNLSFWICFKEILPYVFIDNILTLVSNWISSSLPHVIIRCISWMRKHLGCTWVFNTTVFPLRENSVQVCKLPNSFPKYLNIAMVCEIWVPSISKTGIVPNAYFELSSKNVRELVSTSHSSWLCAHRHSYSKDPGYECKKLLKWLIVVIKLVHIDIFIKFAQILFFPLKIVFACLCNQLHVVAYSIEQHSCSQFMDKLSTSDNILQHATKLLNLLLLDSLQLVIDHPVNKLTTSNTSC